MQEQIDQPEPERAQVMDGPVEGERQDGDRPVQVGHLPFARAPVTACEDPGQLRQVAGEIVLLDDSMVVVDEPGAERSEIDQHTHQGKQENGAPVTNHCFLPPT